MITQATLLHAALIEAGIPIISVRFKKNRFEILYDETANNQQQKDGETIKDSFDISEKSLIEKESNRIKNRAIQTLNNNNDIMSRITKALSLVLLDNINLLRKSTIVIVGSSTISWNITNINNNSSIISQSLFIEGSAVGDIVDVSPPENIKELIIYGYVSTTNNILITVHNTTNNTINITPGTWRITVRRPVNLAPITIENLQDAIISKIQAG